MSDVFSKRKRSEVMSRIRSRGNRDTEMALATILRKEHIAGWRTQRALRFRVRSSVFRVRPDFIFPKQRVAVFVDGCFWHGCPKHSKPAKWLKKSSMAGRGSRKDAKAQRTGKEFWWNKLLANKARDRFVNRTLRRQGWRVVRIWEHELAKKSSQPSAFGYQPILKRIREAIGRKLKAES